MKTTPLFAKWDRYWLPLKILLEVRFNWNTVHRWFRVQTYAKTICLTVKRTKDWSFRWNHTCGLAYFKFGTKVVFAQINRRTLFLYSKKSYLWFAYLNSVLRLLFGQMNRKGLLYLKKSHVWFSIWNSVHSWRFAQINKKTTLPLGKWASDWAVRKKLYILLDLLETRYKSGFFLRLTGRLHFILRSGPESDLFQNFYSRTIY